MAFEETSVEFLAEEFAFDGRRYPALGTVALFSHGRHHLGGCEPVAATPLASSLAVFLSADACVAFLGCKRGTPAFARVLAARTA